MGSRMLLVDDDASLCDIAQVALGRDGFEVHTCQTVESALDALAGGTFDVIVTDVGLPEEDAFELIEHARRHLPGAPIVVLSGDASVETRCYEAGAAAFLVKPASLDALGSEARRVLDSRR